MCLWGDNNFSLLFVEHYHGYNTWSYVGDNGNDTMDSWGNRSGSYDGCMSGNANGTGDHQFMRRGTSDNDVAPWNSDEVSATKTRNGCS